MLYKLSLILVVFSCAISCASQSTTQDQTITNNDLFTTANVADAQYLFISDKGGQLQKATNETKKVYKIKENDEITEVTFKNVNNVTLLPTIDPVVIYNMGENYICIGFGTNKRVITTGFLIEKKTGISYSLDTIGFPITGINAFLNSSAVLGGKNDIFYFISRFVTANGEQYKIINLDLSEPNNLFSKNISSFSDNIYGFLVDKEDNIYYNGAVQSDLANTINRIINKEESIINFPAQTRDVWINPEQKLCYFDSNTKNIISVKIKDNQLKTTIESSFSGNNISNLDILNGWVLNFKNKGYVVSNSLNKIYEVYNETNVPKIVDSLNILEINAITYSDDFYFIAGTNKDNQPVLIKVDSIDNSYINLYTPGEYDVYKLTSNINGELTGAALRFSDGINIIFKVVNVNFNVQKTKNKPTNNFIVIKEISDNKITVLKKI